MMARNWAETCRKETEYLCVVCWLNYCILLQQMCFHSVQRPNLPLRQTGDIISSRVLLYMLMSLVLQLITNYSLRLQLESISLFVSKFVSLWKVAVPSTPPHQTTTLCLAASVLALQVHLPSLCTVAHVAVQGIRTAYIIKCDVSWSNSSQLKNKMAMDSIKKCCK